MVGRASGILSAGMKRRQALSKLDADNRRTADGDLSSKKSVRWSSNDEEDNRRGISTSYVVFAVCLAVGVSGTLALEQLLNLHLMYPVERASRLLVPWFCFGFVFYHLAAYFNNKWTLRSILVLLGTCFAVEALMCLLFGGLLPSWITNFTVFLTVAVITTFSSLSYAHRILVVGMVLFLRFLSYATFDIIADTWRPLLGYLFAVFGVLLSESRRHVITKSMTLSQNHKHGISSENLESKTARFSASVDGSNVAPSRRRSLPIIQKTPGSSVNVKLLKKAETTLFDILSLPDVPMHLQSQLQALYDILKVPESPVVHQRSKSIPFVTLSDGSIFSQQCADLPYTITEDSSYAPKRIRRHYSVSGNCRPSAVWTNNFIMPSLDSNQIPSGDRENLEESFINMLDVNGRFNHEIPLTDATDEDQNAIDEETRQKLDPLDGIEDSERSKLPSGSRKASLTSGRPTHITFAEDPTIINYNPLLDNDIETQLDLETLEDESDDLKSLLEKDMLNCWDFPIFDLARVAPDMMLSRVASKIFVELGLMEAFQIPPTEFLCFFHALETGYRDNPYHNRIHSTDVLHAVYHMTTQKIYGFTQVIPADDYSYEHPDLRTTTLLSRISENGSNGIMGANFLALELMAMLTAAAMHDYDHPGRTNAFLIATCNPLAVLYNNRSVLENHHAAAGWSLLISDPRHAWLVNLNDAEFKRFRYLVIDEILVTDLAHHFSVLADFNAKVNEETGSGLNWMIEDDRLMVSKMMIKMADISGPCKNWQLHMLWTERIAEEFYQQGDEEHSMQLSVSPYMDRDRPQLAKLQESFITHLVAPLCNSLCGSGLLPSYLPENTDNDNESRESSEDIVCQMARNLKDNHTEWVRLMNKDSAEGVQTSP